MADIKLFANKTEQALYEQYADLFAIIQTTEKLETAFIRDDVAAKEYEDASLKLLGQFKTLWGSMRHHVPDVERFIAQYNMQCPMAITRLLKEGIPATQVHLVAPRPVERSDDNLAIAEATAHFITAMDSLKLSMTAVDQVCPALLELLTAMNRIAALPPDFVPRETVKRWYSRLHTLPASQQLGEDDTRQLAYELDGAFAEYMRALKRPGGAK